MDRWGESTLGHGRSVLRSTAGRWRRRPLGPLLGAAAIGVSAYVVLGPLGASRYPMMTDMPFHTAYAAILRHYTDPAWHFREQFALQPLAVPYLSTYVLAGALMTAFDPVVAMKVAVALMLGLLPAGLAVLFHGMRKSPLWGLTGLGFVWSGLTSWGFVNFMGALGLFAMVVGLTLRLLDRPSRAAQGWLAAALVAIFFTHVFRFPFALAAVVGCAIVLYPATHRWRPVLLPTCGSLLLLGLWWALRPAAIGSELGPLRIDWQRLATAGQYLDHSLRDPAEAALELRALRILGWTALAAAALCVLQGRWRQRGRALAWTLGVTVVPLACAAVFLWMYLALPMEIGIWWYVFPREITAAAFIALGALPDLPHSRWLQAPFVLAVALAVVPLGRLTSRHYAEFDAHTRDFDAVIAHIPQAPKLLYLVFDHSGSAAVHTPFIHLPAYVQATRGGWLSFHFATWGASPIVYRSRAEPGAVVPPATPLRWEWTPQRFRLAEHGAFFDWFLVRQRHSPARLFGADPSIRLVAHEGTWWLFHRTSSAAGTARP